MMKLHARHVSARDLVQRGSTSILRVRIFLLLHGVLYSAGAEPSGGRRRCQMFQMHHSDNDWERLIPKGANKLAHVVTDSANASFDFVPTAHAASS
jgi:hypothetical protein